MTTQEIKASKKDMLVPSDIAEVLKCDQYSINLQVKDDKKNGTNSFPFPTILMGVRVRIPRKAFLKALGELEEDEDEGRD